MTVKNKDNFGGLTTLFFAPKNCGNAFFIKIYIEVQESKESTTRRYFFLCETVNLNEVSRLRDSITER